MALNQEISKERILLLRGCYTEEEMKSLQIMSQDKVTLEDILESTEVTLGDKLWFIDRLLTQQQKRDISLIISRVLLKYFTHPLLEDFQGELDAHSNGVISLEELRTSRQNVIADFYYNGTNDIVNLLYRFIIDSYTSYKFTNYSLSLILKDPKVNPEIQADVIRELLNYFKDNDILL